MYDMFFKKERIGLKIGFAILFTNYQVTVSQALLGIVSLSDSPERLLYPNSCKQVPIVFILFH